MSDAKDLIKNDYISGLIPKELAESDNVSLNTIKSWIKHYGWFDLKNKMLVEPSMDVEYLREIYTFTKHYPNKSVVA